MQKNSGEIASLLEEIQGLIDSFEEKDIDTQLAIFESLQAKITSNEDYMRSKEISKKLQTLIELCEEELRKVSEEIAKKQKKRQSLASYDAAAKY